jgi:hypothetical protein
MSEQSKPTMEHKTKLRVLMPADSYLFTRICNVMPHGTKIKQGGTVQYEGAEWQIVEFYKEKQSK